MKIRKVLPGLLGRCLDKVLLGSSHYKLEAESSGNLYLKIQGQMSFLDLMTQNFQKEILHFSSIGQRVCF